MNNLKSLFYHFFALLLRTKSKNYRVIRMANVIPNSLVFFSNTISQKLRNLPPAFTDRPAIMQLNVLKTYEMELP